MDYSKLAALARDLEEVFSRHGLEVVYEVAEGCESGCCPATTTLAVSPLRPDQDAEIVSDLWHMIPRHCRYPDEYVEEGGGFRHKRGTY